MSRFGSQYQVSRPTGLCAATGEPLESGMAAVATLCEHEEGEGFDRLDYSESAWDDGARPERLFCFWRTTYAPPEAKRQLLVDDEVLMDLFNRLAGDERPQRIAFRFVLALILMRKRRLKFVGRTGGSSQAGAGNTEAGKGEGPERWLVRPPGAAGEPPIEVVDPHLADADVRELTSQLGEILEADL